MARSPLGLVVAVASALVACAGPAHRARDAAPLPPAAASEQLRALAGRWQGSLWETAGWYLQGQARLDLTLDRDGTWTGTIGTARAQGTARIEGGRLVLQGTVRSGTTEDPVYFALTGDETRRWAQTLARFGGRQERASISLQKTG